MFIYTVARIPKEFLCYAAALIESTLADSSEDQPNGAG